MNKVVIDSERCKGCGLCIKVCPKSVLAFSGKANSKGYDPAVCGDEGSCIGCAMCAQTCPDIAIEVFTERG